MDKWTETVLQKPITVILACLHGYARWCFYIVCVGYSLHVESIAPTRLSSTVLI